MLQSDASFRKKVFYTDDFNIMHQWLQRGRVQIGINDLQLGSFLLRTSGLSNLIVAHPLPVNDNPVHLMLSKQTVTKADIITLNKAILTVRKTDKYRQILLKYNAPTEPPHRK